MRKFIAAVFGSAVLASTLTPAVAVGRPDSSRGSGTCLAQRAPAAPIEMLVSCIGTRHAAGAGITSATADKSDEEPLICDILRIIHYETGDIPGILEINEQGDIFLMGELFYDCPPYEVDPPTLAG